MKFSSLPFVRTAPPETLWGPATDDDDGEPPSLAIESAWSPARSGNYATDCATGKSYAGELVSYMQEASDPTALGRVIADMQDRCFGGVEIGLLQGLGERLIRAT